MKISDGEMKLMELIWNGAPLRSGELAAKSLELLGWKKSTVYTVIKKLTLKGAIKSEDTVITPLISKDDALSEQSRAIISKGGTLPVFLTAFLQKEKLTRAEAEELKRLIDEYTEVD